VLSDEEADLRAEAERAKNAADRPADSEQPGTTPDAGETDTADAPAEKPAADDGDTGAEEDDGARKRSTETIGRTSIHSSMPPSLVMRAYLLDLSYHVVAGANQVPKDLRSE